MAILKLPLLRGHVAYVQSTDVISIARLPSEDAFEGEDDEEQLFTVIVVHEGSEVETIDYMSDADVDVLARMWANSLRVEGPVIFEMKEDGRSFTSDNYR
jgi:hypothetical protein